MTEIEKESTQQTLPVDPGRGADLDPGIGS
jgi:hypothetical protein